MADRLVELLESPEKRRRMGAAASSAAADMTADAMVQRYFELYESLI
jgi:hypothetical protein